jgi:hypothetical protein
MQTRSLPYAEYAAIPALNATAIKAGRISMQQMHATIAGPRKTATDAMRLGSLAHAVVLELETFCDRLAIWHGDKRGNEWRAFQADHDPDWIVKPEQHEYLLAVRDAVRDCPAARSLLNVMQPEQTCEWTGPGYGAAKCRYDLVDVAGNRFADVKTYSPRSGTRTGILRGFATQAADLGYHLQYGWYAEPLTMAHGAAPVAHTILVLLLPRPEVVVLPVPARMLAEGARQAASIAERYRACERAGMWTGIAAGEDAETEIADWDLPEYAYGAGEELDWSGCGDE